MDLDDFKELYSYNRWANHGTLSAAGRLDSEKFLRPLGNSFSSVRDTLAHILGAEWIWLERWLGHSPRALLNAADFPTVESLRARWSSLEEGYHQFLHSLAPGLIGERLAYINRAGEGYAYPLWQQMVHVVNHSSYHRGQITTMLRQLGAEPVSTDFLAYYDETSDTRWNPARPPAGL
jgi:uncharacterized damage-inducible protein DinB